jgi:hypothetical protein
MEHWLNVELSSRSLNQGRIPIYKLCDRSKKLRPEGVTMRIVRLGTVGLILAGALATALAAMGGAKSASGETLGLPQDPIVGSWLDTGTFTIDGVPVVALAFASNCAGGVWMTYGNSAPTAAGPSFGAWTKTGRRTYTQHSVGFTFDNNGNQNGYFDVVENVVLSEDGNSYTGSAVINSLDLNGNIIPGQAINVTDTGKRVTTQAFQL